MDKSTHPESAGRMAHLTSEDFLALGLEHIAYMKPVHVMGQPAWAVHAADGSPLTLLQQDFKAASATIRQNDLIPVSVH